MRTSEEVFHCAYAWLGKWFLFQTFEELDSIKDKEAEVQQIRRLLDDGQEKPSFCPKCKG